MQGEGVELAPLRGQIILDLSNFDEALDQIQGRIEALSDQLKTAFDDINPDINITATSGIDGEIDQINDLGEAVDEASENINNLSEALNEVNERASDLSGVMDEMNDKMSAFGTMAHENGEESENWGDHMWETAMEMIFVGQEVQEGLESVTESGMAFQASMITGAREFGSYYKNVASWAENACDNIGLSYEQSMSLAEQFGLAMRNYGASASEAGKYSEALVDMSAQIRNATGGTVDYEEASDAFRAALGGQMYSLESLGISVTTAQENQLALNSAWHKAYKDLDTYQQKVILIDAIQQDLNKTFGTTNAYMKSNAGQVDMLTAKLHNSLQLIGFQLLPSVIGVLNDFSHVLSGVDYIASHLGIGQSLLPVLSQLIVIGGGSVIALGVLGKAFSMVGSTVTTAISGISDFINVVKGVDDANMLTSFGKGFLFVKNIAVSAFSVAKTAMLGLVDVMTDTVIPAIGSLVVALGPVGLALIAITAGAVLVYEAWEHNWLGIRGITAGAITDIEKIFNSFITGAKHDITDFATVTGHLFDSWGKDAINIFNDTCHTIMHFLNTNWFIAPILHTGEALFNLLNSLCFGIHKIVNVSLDDLGHLIAGAGESLYNSISGWVEKTFTGFESNTEKITNSNKTMLNDLSADTQTGLNDVSNIFKTGWNDLSEWFDGAVIKPVEPLMDMFVNLLSITNNYMNEINAGIQEKWSSTCDWFGSESMDLVHSIEDLGSDMFNAGVNLIDALGNGIASAWGGFWNSITGDLHSLTSDVDSVVSSVTSFLSGGSVNGSHFNGLNYVPFDGYRAELHKGEMVLTAEQAEAYRGNTGGAGAMNNMEIHFHSPKPIDAFEATNQMKNLSRKIAAGFY